MRADNNFPEREPIIRILANLGLNATEIAQALKCSAATVKKDIQTHLGGLETFAPHRPRTSKDKYRACFSYWSESSVSDNPPAIDRGINTTLRMTEVKAYALAFDASVQLLAQGQYSEAFAPFARLLGIEQCEPKVNDWMIRTLRQKVAQGELLIPASFEEFCRGLQLIFQETTAECDMEIIGKLPNEALAHALAIIAEFEEASERKTRVFKQYHGIGCEARKTTEIAEIEGISRGYVIGIVRELEKKFRAMFKVKMAVHMESINWLRNHAQLLELQLRRAAESAAELEELIASCGGREALSGKQEKYREVVNGHLDKRIIDLFNHGILTERAKNCLINSGIDCIGQLCQLTEAELLKRKNLGRKTLAELKEILAEFGLKTGTYLSKEQESRYRIPWRHYHN